MKKKKFKSLSRILQDRNSKIYKKKIRYLVTKIREKQLEYNNLKISDFKNKIQYYRNKNINENILIEVANATSEYFH